MRAAAFTDRMGGAPTVVPMSPARSLDGRPWALASTLLSHTCPILIIPAHLLDAAGRLLRVLGPQARVQML
ncbi:hypothetical protein [Synechococcus sp. A15-44]|uniref:hypothetical protein n=1 Tax=Synechococcus sp. A15-44 TaxID=1050646 RepID=UPI0016444ACC|nr:hypothetical protein [Synechococcus sp. A15-44]